MNIEFSIIGPIGTRDFVLDKICEESVGHEHNYDHITLVIRGRLRIKYSYTENDKLVEGESRDYSQGEKILIKANVRHTVKALEDNTLYTCIFSHRDFDGLVTQNYLGHGKAYV